MECKRLKSAAALVVLLPGVASAQLMPSDSDIRDLLSTGSLRCAFYWYASVDWDADEPDADIATEEDFIFQIDAIDLSGGTARMIGNSAAADLNLISGADRLSFMELTPIGAINLTTVYAWRDSEGSFKSVHSRHIAIRGPFPSQHYGRCEPWD